MRALCQSLVSERGKDGRSLPARLKIQPPPWVRRASFLAFSPAIGFYRYAWRLLKVVSLWDGPLEALATFGDPGPAAARSHAPALSSLLCRLPQDVLDHARVLQRSIRRRAPCASSSGDSTALTLFCCRKTAGARAFCPPLAALFAVSMASKIIACELFVKKSCRCRRYEQCPGWLVASAHTT